MFRNGNLKLEFSNVKSTCIQDEQYALLDNLHNTVKYHSNLKLAIKSHKGSARVYGLHGYNICSYMRRTLLREHERAFG